MQLPARSLFSRKTERTRISKSNCKPQLQGMYCTAAVNIVLYPNPLVNSVLDFAKYQSHYLKSRGALVLMISFFLFFSIAGTSTHPAVLFMATL